MTENIKQQNIFDTMLTSLFKEEGGYAVIKGQPTFKGVEQRTANAYFKRKGLPSKSVKNMTDDEIKNLYFEDFYKSHKIDNIPSDRVQNFLFRFGVNFYPVHTIRMIQKITGTKPDGKIGPKTIKAVEDYINQNGEDELLKKALDLAEERYKGIVEKDPEEKQWLNGWLNRIKNFKKEFDLSALNPFARDAYAGEIPDMKTFTLAEIMAREEARDVLPVKEQKTFTLDDIIAREKGREPGLFFQSARGPMREVTPEERQADFDYSITKFADKLFTDHTGLTPEEGILGKRKFEKAISLPVRTFLMGPIYSLAFETYWQAKSAVVAGLKEEKYSPLEQRVLSELLPDDMNKWISGSIYVGEALGDIALMAGLSAMAKEGTLKDTLKTIGKKLEKAGYGTDKVTIPKEAIKEAVKRTTLEQNAKAWVKAKMWKPKGIETQKPPLQIGSGEVPPVAGAPMKPPPAATPSAPVKPPAVPVSIDEQARQAVAEGKSLEEFVDDSFTVKPPPKIYRGVMDSGKGSGTYSLGKGLYSTPTKAFLKGLKFDKIIELSAEEAYPRNPLVVDTRKESFEDWLLKESGEKRLSEFNKKYNITEFVKSKGYDGVISGDEIVKYDTSLTKSQLTAAYEKASQTTDLDTQAQKAVAEGKSLEEFVESQYDYRGHHTAPTREHSDFYGALHEMDKTYPEDIYTAPMAWNYYGIGGKDKPMDLKSLDIIRSVRGNPDAEITIYRSVPKGKQSEINPGDWVSINKQYVKMHGERFDEGQDIIEKVVKAGDIFTEGNSIHEYGYDPMEGGLPTKSQLTSAYEKAKGAAPAEGGKVTPPAKPPEKPPVATAGEDEPSGWDDDADLLKMVSVDPATKKSALDRMIDKLESVERRIEIAKDALPYLEGIKKGLLRTIKRYDNDYLKEELDEIPKHYITTNKHASNPDEIIQELNNEYGLNLSGESELASYLQDLDTQIAGLKEQAKQKYVKTAETTTLKQRIQDLKTGIREGTIQAKKDIKAVQNEVIELLSDKELDAADKGKFLAAIKNIQTQEQLEKALPKISERVDNLIERAEKKEALAQIKKELTSTKPVKVGPTVKGKYDYETNKLFNKIRDWFKLSKQDAQELLAITPQDELDIIKSRILHLRANGMESSAALIKQVLADIKRIKLEGSMAKNEEEFLKKINQNIVAEKALQGLAKVKGDKSTILGKIESGYLQGFSNTHSILNALFGKEFADIYDPEPLQAAHFTDIFTKEVSLTNKAIKILGVKDKFEYVDYVFKMMQNKVSIIAKDGLKTEITKVELLDIYNSLKNDLIRERYFNAFGQEQLDALLSELTPKEMELADHWQEVVNEYYPVLNQRNIELKGQDLGRRVNYWPATSETPVIITDDYRVQGQLPSSMKQLVESDKVIPVPNNAVYKVNKAVVEGEQIRTLSRRYEELKRMATNRAVKNQIIEKFGENVYRVLLDHIETISLNKLSPVIDEISKFLGRGVNNWVTSQIAVNPSTFARQLVSIINYAEVMPAGVWGKYFVNTLTHPKETFDFMWNNCPYLQARYNKGYSEALQEVMKGANEIQKGLASWHKGLTAFVRSGDITAIILGGRPYVKYLVEEKKMPLKEAMDQFVAATIKAQQSGLTSGISGFQRGMNPLGRILLAFKNTAHQYARKMADAIISYNNGDITADQLVKTMVIYGIINPVLYTTAGHYTKQAIGFIIGSIIAAVTGKKLTEKEEEENVLLEDMTLQLLLGPFNAIPLLSDGLNAAIRKAQKRRIYKAFSVPMIDSLETAFRKATKKEPTFLDWVEVLSVAAEVGVAYPSTLTRQLKHFKTPKESKKTYKTRSEPKKTYKTRR